MYLSTSHIRTEISHKRKEDCPKMSFHMKQNVIDVVDTISVVKNLWMGKYS
jgi:hypothetical protein